MKRVGCQVCGAMGPHDRCDPSAVVAKWNRLCWKLALMAKRSPLSEWCDEDDLVQEARIALVSAMERYKVLLGAFSTYATAYIRGCLKTYVRNTRLIHVPQYMLDRTYKQKRDTSEEASRAAYRDRFVDIDSVGLFRQGNERDEDERLPPLRTALLLLPRDEREFLLCRYGIHRPPSTLAEMGALQGTTADGARLFQNRIFTKVRRLMSV